MPPSPPQPTRLASLLRPWTLIWPSICLHWQALIEAVRRNGLAALLHPRQIRDAASAKLLSITSSGFIAYEDTTVVPSLVRAASGVILDLGPGPGNQIHRFDASAVEYIYGVEPNGNFKDDIMVKLEKHGLADKYRLLACGIEDSDILRAEGIAEGSLDSVLCIQVLCAVRDPKSVMREVWKLLKPGGKFIFWEHGCSRDSVTRAAQALWNPAWSTFVGCRLDRNVLADILNSGEWENPGEIEEPEDRLSCLPRIQGVLVKKA
ncbi:class I SAM-dependent methyltransferase [Aspergillus mulundensis]|uniref:Methyltransferase type 11 domain-containing protein n=1 Tax=Aspergillus mulundensis TaxID=1810919 RepID=A0A3D8RRF2_9EURO|nr:Uncharacterized protein DSM5745_06436 [Aspergillus mulundensis]RDW76444.1 Uncharacterized protein DSM5745_06436 [Aspergillus mulundensis]